MGFIFTEKLLNAKILKMQKCIYSLKQGMLTAVRS
jgi:hypothetical protein